MSTYVLYHGNCPDGFSAAWAARKILGDQAHYVPVQHHQPFPDLEGCTTLYIVDFSYPKQTLLDWTTRMEKIIVLDHHKTAQHDLSGLPPLEEAEQGNSTIGVRFDMNKSGAVLAWEFFHPEKAVPQLLLYVQDKDLWRFQLPQSKAVSAALDSYAKEFEVWDALELGRLKHEGRIILRMTNRLVDRLCQSVYWKDVGDHCVPIVNTPILGSEIGNELCLRFPEAPFAACYSDIGEKKRKWELRSIGDFDVSEVAKEFGGGGHKNASGFTEQFRSD